MTEQKPKRGRPSNGLSEVQCMFRAPRELLDAVAVASKKAGVSTSEWWRRAARLALEAGAKETHATDS